MIIEIEINDIDLKCLNNDLLDVDQWVKDAVNGKISQCKSRMIKEWTPRLMNDPKVSMIPANEKELINLIIARDDYKDRKERENDPLRT